MHVVYNVFKDDLLAKDINFKEDSIMVALMRAGFPLNRWDITWNDVCGIEIKGGGYKAGGQILRNVRLVRTEGLISLHGDNPVWQSAKFSAYFVMLYFAETKKLIGCVKLPETSVNGANFTLEWNSMGILTEDMPDAPPQYLKHYLKKEEL